MRRRARGADVHAGTKTSRDRGPEAEGLRMHQDRVPARRVVQEPEKGARRLSPGRLELDDDEVALRSWREALEVDPERDDSVLPVEAFGRSLGDLRRRREQGVDPRLSRSRRERRAGYTSRSTEKNVAAVARASS